MKVGALGFEQPIILVAAGCGPGLFVVYCFVHCVVPNEYALAPPNVCQLTRASLFMGTHPDHAS